jgi:phosphoglycerate dehydrogenase-like enzyme
MHRVAIIDDYQGVALDLADWSSVRPWAEVSVFRDTLKDHDALAARLEDFDVICVMRERTPFPRQLMDRLTRLKLIVSTGSRNASIDVEAADQLNIEIAHTSYFPQPAAEHAWALILGAARHLVGEVNAVRHGRWQQSIGVGLHGKTLALLGLGTIGSIVARVGLAFGMRVIAWSENLTVEKAAEVGVERVSKEVLFAEADFLSIHLVLSHRSKGLVNDSVLRLMKPTAFLVNTSRSGLVDEADLLSALTARRIAGAAVDVFEEEPLATDHPYRHMDNVLATPHIGYVVDDLYKAFYQDTADHVAEWLARHRDG